MINVSNERTAETRFCLDSMRRSIFFGHSLYDEDLENNILSKFKSDKNFTKKVKENYIYLHNKNLLSENFTSKGMVLKISGIWETHTNIGLTFKFININ